MPGILFRYFYRRGVWESPVHLSSILNELYYGLFLSIPIHLIAFMFVRLFGYRYDYSAILSLLAGHFENDVFVHVVQTIKRSFVLVLIYHTLTCSLSALAGLSAHIVVRKQHLDLRYRWLRFQNDWYYTFYGERLVMAILQEGRDRKRRVTNRAIDEFLATVEVYVSVVVVFGTVDILYYGRVDSYNYDRAGKLSRIILTNVLRRELTNDADERGEGEQSHDVAGDPRYYRILGDYFVVDAQDIKTLNVEYVYIVKKEPESTATRNSAGVTERAMPGFRAVSGSRKSQRALRHSDLPIRLRNSSLVG